VTGQATQTTFAPPETGARGQQQRLVARIPGIPQIRRVGRLGGHAVALSAKAVKLVGREPAWILRTEPFRVPRMGGSGAMARLTAHTQLTGRDRMIPGDTDWPGRVAGEAAEDCGRGIKDPVSYAGGVLMARRAGVPTERPVPTFVLFQIRFRVQPSHERHGLHARAKSPVAGLGLLCGSQRAGMRAG
jgi:hypothetical protein